MCPGGESNPSESRKVFFSLLFCAEYTAIGVTPGLPSGASRMRPATDYIELTKTHTNV